MPTAYALIKRLDEGKIKLAKICTEAPSISNLGDKFKKKHKPVKKDPKLEHHPQEDIAWLMTKLNNTD